MRLFFRVEYDGTGYAGWQVQPNGPSIQAALNQAFSTAVRTPCQVVGAGRTDAGVHARGQGAHVDLPGTVDISRCQLSVNALLPHDIAIYDSREVDDSFHARFSASRRCYRYWFVDRRMPLRHKRAWMVFHRIDWARVAENAGDCLGTHDFTAFCSSDTDTGNMTCSVTEARLDEDGETRVFTIQADRFVYKMVRSLVGTLIDIGRGRLDGPLGSILASRDRTRVGETAPACGLVLDHVTYPEV